MLLPLVLLAILSVIGGWVGYHNNFENFLAPVFRSGAPAAAGGPGSAPAAQTEQAAAQPAESRAPEGGLETLLMSISIAAALGGLMLAWLFYYSRPQIPQRIALALGGFYEAVLHKYYVDELYATVFVKPLIAGSTKVLWHGIDQGIIDAAVDNSAEGAREVSDTMRHMQSGNLRSYAGWIAAGAAGVIAYMVWMGTR
jgi:NADH-quinone oxidoreductase subunit L